MYYSVSFPHHHRHHVANIHDKENILQKPDPPPSGKVERVRLVQYTDEMGKHHLQYKVGVIEDCIDEEVLVRFGEVVVQVPAE